MTAPSSLAKSRPLFWLRCVFWLCPGEVDGAWDSAGGGRMTCKEEKKGWKKIWEQSYQHPPRQKNRGTMKAKSREERGRDWQAQTEAGWRLKWQRDKWGKRYGENERVNSGQLRMKQETIKRLRERQPDRETSLAIKTHVDSPCGPDEEQIRKEGTIQTSVLNRKIPEKRANNTVVFLKEASSAELRAPHCWLSGWGLSSH